MTSSNFSKFNKMLIEVLSVIFAVLVALGVDQWWEDRENLELAQKMRTGIESEFRENLKEIERTNENYTTTSDTLRMHLAEEVVTLDNVNINLELAVLTSATWHTAQMLRAIHYMDYEWVIKVSSQYELQSIYLDTQKQLLEVMGRLAEMDAEENPRKILRTIVGRLMIMISLQNGLIEGFTDLLPETAAADSTSASD